MKKVLVLLFCIVFAVFTFTCYAQIKQDSQKFNVTYTIIYNALTLEEAARLETVIKEKFSEACSVKIDIKEVEGTITISDVTTDVTTSGYIYTQ